MKKAFLLLCLILMLGSASASIAIRTDDGAALTDADGGEIVPFGMYSDIVCLDDNLFAAQIGEAYALMNGEGTLLTEAVYEHFHLESNLLAARMNGLWRMLDRNGNALTDALYTLIVPNGNGGAWAISGTNGDIEADELLLLNPDGAQISSGLHIRRMDSGAGNGLLAVLLADGNLFGYCNAEGEMVIEPRFASAGRFAGGLAVVASEEGFGVIDAEGNQILPEKYAFADISPAGFILAQDAGGVYAFDKEGKALAEHPGEGLSAHLVGGGYALWNGESLRVYDGTARQLLSLPADAAVYPGGDRLIVSEGAWGEECVFLSGSQRRYQNLFCLGTAQGETVYAFMEANVARYMNNLLGEVQLSVDMGSARYGIADGNGEVLLPARYRSIQYLADNRFLVRTDSQWRMIDRHGAVLWRKNADLLS